MIFMAIIAATFSANFDSKSFTGIDGLVDQYITALHRQTDGLLWIGTQSGLVQFDGVEFKDAGQLQGAPQVLIKEFVHFEDRLFVVSDDAVWVKQDSRFEQIFSRPGFGIQQSLATSDGLWLSAMGTMLKIQKGAVRQYGVEQGLPQRVPTALMQTRDGAIWSAWNNGGIRIFNPQQDRWEMPTFQSIIQNVTVNHLSEHSDGSIWLATLSGVMVYRDGVLDSPQWNERLPTSVVYQTLESPNKDVWLRLGRGVARLDQVGMRIFKRGDGLISNQVFRIEGDRSGRVWMLSRRGLSFVDQAGVMTSLTEEDGLSSNYMTSFATDTEGLIWLGTARGLTRLAEPAMQTFFEDNRRRALSPSSPIFQIIKDDADRLWFASLVGLGMWDGQKFSVFKQQNGLPADEITAFAQDSQGHIWVGTIAGLALYDGFRFTPVPRFNNSPILALKNAGNRGVLVMDDSRSVYFADGNFSDALPNFQRFEQMANIIGLHPIDDDRLWLHSFSRIFLCDYSGRVLHIHGIEGAPAVAFKGPAALVALPNGVRRFRGARVEELTLFSSEENQIIRDIWAGEDSFWVWAHDDSPGSQRTHRLFKIYDDREEELPWLESLGSELQISKVLPSPNESFVFTNKGLARWMGNGWAGLMGVPQGLAGNQPNDVLSVDSAQLWIASNGGLTKYDRRQFLVSSFSVEEGLLDREILDLETDTHGALWLRSRAGVQRFMPRETTPQISIAGLRVGNVRVPAEEGLRLGPRENNLSFQLQVAYLAPGAEKIQYRYQLSSARESFFGVTPETQLNFPSLSPGQYRLEVNAFNRNLKTVEEPVVFHFVIAKPIWLRAWFLISAVLFFVVSSYILYRLRLRGRLEQERIQNELQTAHDMQMGLMPLEPPNLSGLEVHAICVPAKEVGGDFYEYLFDNKNPHYFGFAIMDVSGKSMGAAMISVMTSGLVLAESGKGGSPAEILSQINYPLYRKTHKHVFTTGLVGDLNLKTGLMRFSNAGHMDPVIFRDGKPMSLDVPVRKDLPLGGLRNWNYQQREVLLQPGDTVLTYTDGLSEAMNKHGDMFGDLQVIKTMQAFSHCEPRVLVDKLLNEVRRFVDGVEQHDDMTLLVFRYSGEATAAVASVGR